MRMVTDDNELAFRAAEGDRQAFRVLLERHYDRVYRVALRYFGNVADAEDLAQDVCVALPTKLKSFRGRAQFTSWLYRLVINKCRDVGRRRSTMNAFIEGYAEVAALVEGGHADTQRQISWLYETLAELSDELCETALLVLAEDMTHAEAGEVLGIKESTVSWRMHEIRKKLKALAEAGDGGRDDR
jgi:RNA polymerase sigma-70 factor (ECF subfamily)